MMSDSEAVLPGLGGSVPPEDISRPFLGRERVEPDPAQSDTADTVDVSLESNPVTTWRPERLSSKALSSSSAITALFLHTLNQSHSNFS